jgi:hypothetical protein
MIHEVFNFEGIDLHIAKAADYYIEALRAIIVLDEQTTDLKLKLCREALLDGRHWLELTNADLQAIVPDPNFTTDNFYAMFGDYESTSKGPWIRDEDLLAMIGLHIAVLGTPADHANYSKMICNNMEVFKLVPALRVA